MHAGVQDLVQVVSVGTRGRGERSQACPRPDPWTGHGHPKSRARFGSQREGGKDLASVPSLRSPEQPCRLLPPPYARRSLSFPSAAFLLSLPLGDGRAVT